jgi:hypothetical protein
MKQIIKSFLFGAGFMFALSGFLHAQEAATQNGTVSSADTATTVDSLTDLQVMLQAVESVPPMPAQSLPDAGTYWSAQHAPGSTEEWPPLPSNFGHSAWSLGDDGVYLLNDTNVDYDALEAAEAAQAALPSPMTRKSTMARNLASSYAYGNPLYLTNMAAVPDGSGNMIASFSVTGGTNFVPYDILMSTNIAAPIASWNWLGIGYASNSYTFYGQDADLAFYVLAKPSMTMTVGFGDDTVGQCDVPFGLTNSLQVTGGAGQSLALKTDGTVVAWGQNTYGEGVVPTNLTGVAMITAGWYHNVALLTNGTVTAWGLDVPALGYYLTNVPPNLTNATVISAQALHTLALRSDGTVVAWGYNTSFGETNVPAGLTNVTAISAGFQFNLVVSNGYVVAWGDNTAGQCNVPSGLSNVVDVAAGTFQSLALLQNGTVVAWGDNDDGETNVPVGLSNVVAIAAGGDPDIDTAYCLALRSDGTVVAWGDDDAVDPVQGLSNVIAIAAGADHALAVRTGPATPVITVLPTDQYEIAGSTATFTARGAGLYGVTYQWQTNGVNLPGATNAALTLTNVQAAQAGIYDVVVTDNGGMGSITSSNANLYLVTPPVITSRTLPTNQVCIYGNYLSFAVTATAPYQANGFPLSYQWQSNGTNIGGATSNSYSFLANASGNYSVIVSNAAGSVSAIWSVTLTNINVTNDLLLIYNTNSADSATVLNYYIAHRPMVSGANVLGIGCTNGEIVGSATFTNQILMPYLNWLTANPTKHPQYLILFLDIPSRVEDGGTVWPSVQYQLYSETPSGQPFITSINLNGTNDCIAYINKLAAFGTNGQLVISASAGSYGNTNFVLDNVRHGPGFGDGNNSSGYPDSSNSIYGAIPAITNANTNAGITYIDGVETTNVPFLPHITNAVNVAGYICWGGHSDWGTTIDDGNFPLDGNTRWTGNDGWWIIKTLESYNGQRDIGSGQSNFEKWFSPNAFGGTNYSNTPVGACSNVEEPGLEGSSTISAYFSLWASGKNFGICAWNAINSHYFQAVGDPFVTR